jgi:glucose-6-phosphate dehydrogenase assembly protein OpcA
MVEGGAVWSEQDTTPSAIEAALREMLKEQFQQDEAYVPARVLNLVVVVDREWRGEIMNRLEQVGRYHASRTILCAVEQGRETIDAWAAITPAGEHRPGELALTRERIVLDIGPRHLAKLDTIVDPLVVTDIATLTWSPHGHADAVDALLGLAQVVLIDSVNEPDAAAGVRRALELARQAYVVDLAWLRSTPWRERVATTFDPPRWRPELGRIDSVSVRHRPDSAAAGLLFCGWLASRLGWEAGSLVPANGSLHGKAHGKRQDVTLELVPDERQSVPGLAGVEISTASGMSISLDRGPGGLAARRVDRKGRESTWTVLGASRGEGGILGEGIRQALLRDPAYERALGCSKSMLT